VYNFSAGPAVLPEPVLRQVQEEMLDYHGLGAGVVEISHRSKEFEEIVDDAIATFRSLTGLPEDYRVLFVTGGGRMQFSAVPLNLIGRSPSRLAQYVETDTFAALAAKDAGPFGDIRILASSKATRFDRIPPFDPAAVDPKAAYVHITTNNTVHGTRWAAFPDTGKVPLVGDMTSEMLSRQVDFTRFGLAFAGLQKNLGPAGTALVVVRKDLLGHADPRTPPVIDYSQVDKAKSLLNTPNSFAIYVTRLVLRWMVAEGGLPEIERRNEQKANLLYGAIDGSGGFYRGHAVPQDRSRMNVTFFLPTEELLARFLKEADKEGLYALKGYRDVGGVRASIYNAMPVAGVEALVAFMKEFKRKAG
jgi:phosphoserine aminotransferase